jgi:putative alpha-1,2-mannosidase
VRWVFTPSILQTVFIVNGKPYQKNYITHQDIENGGVIEFFMGKTPNKKMATYEKPLAIAR